MTKFNFQNATIKTVRLLGVTTIAVTLAAAHPGAHADQRPALVDNANHSEVSTAVGTVNAFHAALAKGNTAAALSLRADLAEGSGSVRRGTSALIESIQSSMGEGGAPEQVGNTPAINVPSAASAPRAQRQGGLCRRQGDGPDRGRRHPAPHG